MVDHVQHRCLIFTNYACPYKTRSVNSAEYTKTLQEGQGAPLRSSTICRQFSCWKQLIGWACVPFQAYGIILRQYGVIYPDNDLPIIFCHMYSWLCVLLSQPSIMLCMSKHRLCNMYTTLYNIKPFALDIWHTECLLAANIIFLAAL